MRRSRSARSPAWSQPRKATPASERRRSVGPRRPRPGCRPSPSSSGRWRKTRDREVRQGKRPRGDHDAGLGRGEVAFRDVIDRERRRGFRAPLRRLLEPHLPLQPRLRALLPRRRREALGRRRSGLLRPERADDRQCFKVVDDIAAFAPEAVTILTGGEPLLRRDILEIVRYAHAKGLWVVVGTNGVKITPTLAALLQKEGVRGLSLSLDALDRRPARPVSARCAAPGRTRSRARASCARPASPSSFRRPSAPTTWTSSRRSPRSLTPSSLQACGTSTSSSRPGAARSSRTSPPRPTTASSRAARGSSATTRDGCWSTPSAPRTTSRP